METKTLILKWKKHPIKLVVRNKSMSDEGAVDEIFEKKIYHDLFKDVEGKVVVDAGAYIGDSTVILGAIGAKKIYAYEIHPELQKMLALNVANSGLSDVVEIRKVGLSNSPKKMEISGRPNTSFGNGRGMFLKENDKWKVKVVPAEREFQKIIEKEGPIELVKLDIEGFELNVVLSLSKDTFSNISRFIIECHNRMILEEVEKMLERNSFKVTKKMQSPRNKAITLLEAKKV
jgi:FkbM family methyltransferase